VAKTKHLATSVSVDHTLQTPDRRDCVGVDHSLQTPDRHDCVGVDLTLQTPDCVGVDLKL
jgi:hypothetical protein